MGLLILSPQMRVSTVLSVVFFLTSSLFLSTDGLSSGFSLGKKGKAKEAPADDEATKEEETPKEEEAAEAGAEDEGTDADAEEKTTSEAEDSGDSGDSQKDKILELISKLKEMNTFLNEMVTYWDKEAGGGKDPKESESDAPDDADAADAADADAAAVDGKTVEKDEEAVAEDAAETETRRKKRMKRRF